MSESSNVERYDELYVQFIYYFNEERDYFECHEVMEELWLNEGRDLYYQGLLQVAVALYHFRNDNLSGAVKLFTGALEKLTPQMMLDGQRQGIHLQKVISESEVYLNRLLQYETSPFEYYDLTIEVTDSRLQQLVKELAVNPPIKEDHH